MVSGFLDEEPIHVLVNHWSSRRDGEQETEPKRLAAAEKVIEIINTLENQYDNPKIVVIGDGAVGKTSMLHRYA